MIDLIIAHDDEFVFPHSPWFVFLLDSIAELSADFSSFLTKMRSSTSRPRMIISSVCKW